MIPTVGMNRAMRLTRSLSSSMRRIMSPRENDSSRVLLLDSLPSFRRALGKMSTVGGRLTPSAHRVIEEPDRQYQALPAASCASFPISIHSSASLTVSPFLTVADLLGTAQVQHALSLRHDPPHDLVQMLSNQGRVRRVREREREGRLEQRVEEVKQVDTCVERALGYQRVTVVSDRTRSWLGVPWRTPRRYTPKGLRRIWSRT